MPYDWGTVFASAPIFTDDDIRIYYGASDWYFFDWRRGYLALATLRPDGWAGYEPDSSDTDAFITTEALAFEGETVGITADVREGGSVRVAILDEADKQQAISEPVRRHSHRFPDEMDREPGFGSAPRSEDSPQISTP